MSNVNGLQQFERYLYAYGSLLLQLAAQQMDLALTDAAHELFHMHEELKQKSDSMGIDEFDMFLFKLRICTLNLHVSVINHGYRDITAICDALDQLISITQEEW